MMMSCHDDAVDEIYSNGDDGVGDDQILLEQSKNHSLILINERKLIGKLTLIEKSEQP